MKQNENLMNFEILNLSAISKFSKLLGNLHYSLFRNLATKEKYFNF